MENIQNEKPFEKGETIEITIDDMTEQGRGIGKVKGFTFFVAGAVFGDRVSAQVTKVKKRYGFADAKEIIEASPYRADYVCPHASQCGGCSLAGLSYEGQLKLKEKQVADKIRRLAKIDEPVIREIIPSVDTERYRNKATMATSRGSIGFYQSGTRRIMDMQDCLLQKPVVAAVASAIRQFMKEDHITTYNDKTGKGLMRHVTVRTAESTGQVMVILVINGKGIPNGEKLVGMMDDAVYALPEREDGSFFSLESVIVNIDKGKDKDTKIGGIYGKKTEVLAGASVIKDVNSELNFEISPLAFYQVNSKTTELLYGKAMEYAAMEGGETVLDLYCGVGTIGLMACKRGAGKVIGIEEVREAVLDANRNAVINNIVPARYVEGRAETVLPELIKGEGKAEDDPWLKVDTVDVVFIDPPRKGCDNRLLDAACMAEPKKIVYVSCDPGTLARDIAYLQEKGYVLEEITPVDMFPQTMHVECVALMTRK